MPHQRNILHITSTPDSLERRSVSLNDSSRFSFYLLFCLIVVLVVSSVFSFGSPYSACHPHHIMVFSITERNEGLL